MACFQQEGINLALTNRIPRRLVDALHGLVQHDRTAARARPLASASLKMFAGDPHLHEAKKTHFTSLRDCFIRELKRRCARRSMRRHACWSVLAMRSLVRPAAFDGGELIQAKGSTYTLDELAHRSQSRRALS